MDAGASDEKARRAAEAMANYDNRFNQLERRIDTLQSDLERKIAAVQSDIERKIAAVQSELALLRWMVVTGIGISLAILVKLFVH